MEETQQQELQSTCQVKRKPGNAGMQSPQRYNLVIEPMPMFSSAGAYPLALYTTDTEQKSHRTIDPDALKIPSRKGRNLH
jgi:hypothetical protein